MIHSKGQSVLDFNNITPPSVLSNKYNVYIPLTMHLVNKQVKYLQVFNMYIDWAMFIASWTVWVTAMSSPSRASSTIALPISTVTRTLQRRCQLRRRSWREECSGESHVSRLRSHCFILKSINISHNVI